MIKHAIISKFALIRLIYFSLFGVYNLCTPIFYKEYNVELHETFSNTA